MRWLPPLNALRSFEAVGRLRNVKAAAWELNVSAAAVNHQIRLLEEHLGVDLFARTRAGLALTPDGRKFFDHVSFALEHVMRGYRQIGNHDVRNRILVDAPPSFAIDYLMPRLKKFHDQYPDLLLEVNAKSDPTSPINFADSMVDVAIHAAPAGSAWQGLQAEKLFQAEVTPVCSPALLNGPVPLEKPSDLANHTLLIGHAAAVGWEEWIAAAEAQGHDMTGVDLRRGMFFNQIQLSSVGAQNGMGVDLGRTPMCIDHLRKGALIAPFNIRVLQDVVYWLLCPKKSAQTDAVRAFRTWLIKQVEADIAAPVLAPEPQKKSSVKLKLV